MALNILCLSGQHKRKLKNNGILVMANLFLSNFTLIV